MAIKEMANGKFKVNVYMGADAPRFVDYADTKAEAQIIENEAKGRKLRGETKERKKDYTFEEVYKQWWENDYTVYGGLQGETLVNTEKIVRLHVLPHLGKKKIRKISLKDLEQLQILWAFGKPKEGIKPYVNFKICISYTRMIMKYAQKHGYIQINHFDLLERPVNRELNEARKQKRKEKYYSIELVETTQKLIKVECCFQTYTIFTLMYSLGAGKGEVRPLIWSDINFEEKTIALTHKLIKNMTTKKFERVEGGKNVYRPRVVPITNAVVDLLKEWKEIQALMLELQGIEQTPEQFLFTYTNQKGEINLPIHPDWLNDRLRLVTDKYNLPNITPHGLRHTFVSDLMNEGVSEWNIKSLVGHAPDSNMINEVYGHMTKRGQQENIKAVHTLEELRNDSD